MVLKALLGCYQTTGITGKQGSEAGNWMSAEHQTTETLQRSRHAKTEGTHPV